MSRKIDLSDQGTRRNMAEKVRTLRVDQNLSQSDLAELVGVSRQSINDIEGGKKVPREKTLHKILNVLGVEVDGVAFDVATERQLVIMGTMIEAIPTEQRADAVDRAIGVLAAAVHQGGIVRGRTHNVDLHEIDVTQLALAATGDTSTVEEQSAPDYENESQDDHDKEKP